MVTKALLYEEIDNLDEDYLDEVYHLIKHFAQAKEMSDPAMIEIGSRPGGPCAMIKGTRIAVREIVNYLKAGETPESLVREILPSLTVAQVTSALNYYYDHQAEIEQELRANTEETTRAYLREQLGEEGYRAVTGQKYG